MTNNGMHYCPVQGTAVSVEQGVEHCMVEHQCFSDGACPLQQKFDEQASREHKAARLMLEQRHPNA